MVFISLKKTREKTILPLIELKDHPSSKKKQKNNFIKIKLKISKEMGKANIQKYSFLESLLLLKNSKEWG